VLIALAAVLLGSVPLLVGTFRQVEIPRLVGQTKAAAERSLRDAGFNVTTDVENSATVPEGHVIRTDPAGGTSARKGSTVRLIVSAGPVTVQMPNVINTKFEAARDQLEQLGLKVARKDAFHPTIKKGNVVAQDKDPDVLLNAGTTVTLTVSKGVERVAVPDVKNKTQADATQILTTAGFTVTIQRADNDTVPAGHVVSQTPGAGTKADKGSAVTLVISNGPPKVAVPNLQCMTRKQAADVLAARGLQIKFVGSERRVVDQDPQPGQQVPRGSVVTAYTGPGTYC
jgi:eukaryotic-like serine/threonine-protein kinase